MIYLIHGENTLFAEQKIKELTLNHKLSFFDGKDFSLMRFKEISKRLGLFGEPQAILVKSLLSSNLSKKTEEEIINTLSHESQEVVIFYEKEKAKEQSTLFKWISKKGKVFHFPALTKYKIKNWISEELSSTGIKINPEALNLLVEGLSFDLMTLKHEIEKLSFYIGKGGTISIQDVEEVSALDFQKNIFQLSDALGMQNAKEALEILHNLLREGKAFSYLVVMLARQMKLLIKTRVYLNEGKKFQEIQKELGLPPFVVKKLLGQARNFSLNRLKVLFSKILLTDWWIKKGRLNSDLGLDLLIHEICLKTSL